MYSWRYCSLPLADVELTVDRVPMETCNISRQHQVRKPQREKRKCCPMQDQALWKRLAVKIIKEMEEGGIILKSSNDWEAPIVLVSKKD